MLRSLLHSLDYNSRAHFASGVLVSGAVAVCGVAAVGGALRWCGMPLLGGTLFLGGTLLLGGAALLALRTSALFRLRLQPLRCLFLKSAWAVLLGVLMLNAASAQTRQIPVPIRVAIVGLVHGHVHGFLEQYRHNPAIEIVAVVEPDAKLRASAADKYGFSASQMFSNLEEMIAKVHPQAVLVYTNTYDHRRVVEICARHGVHVMMEKPLAVSVEDALAMQKAAEAGNIHVLVNYETSWYRSNHAVYDLVHNRSIGDIRKVVVHDGHQGPQEIGVQPEFLSWLTDPKLDGGGALFDFGCYGADLMTWLMDGQRPQTVTAITQQIKPEIYQHVDDEATIVLTYPHAQAIIQASWNWPMGRKDMEVYGKTGYVITVQRDEIRLRQNEKEPEQQRTTKRIPAPYDDELAYFRAVILEGAKEDELSSLGTNVIATEIMDAAQRSAREGRTVQLENTK